MPTAAEKREEGNELFRRGEHRAAAKAYGDAIAAAAFEIGQLAMDLAEPDGANPGGAQAPGPGMVPGKLKEVCVACHANRAACYLALAEGEGERPSLALQLAGETEQLACIVPEFGAQAAALEALRTLPLAQAEAAPKGELEEFALVLDGAATPVGGWAQLCRDSAARFPAARAVLLVGRDDVLHFPTDGAAAVLAKLPGPPIPVACLRRDEGGALLQGEASITLRFATAASWYRLVIEDCSAAMRLSDGAHVKAQLRRATALEALGALELAHAEYNTAAQEASVRKKARAGAKRTLRCVKACKEGAEVLPDEAVWALSAAPLRPPGDATAEGGGEGAVFVAVVGLERGGLRQIAAQVVNEPGPRKD